MSSNVTDPYRVSVARRFRIKLTCGCTILSRTPPRMPDSKFMCGSGLAHGYSLGWTRSAHPDGRIDTNIKQGA